MRFIARIGEGESWTSAFIGYKWFEYRDINDESVWVLRMGLNLGFALIKFEYIPL